MLQAQNVPIRLAMKPGVSWARTTPLPRRRSAKLDTASTISGKVSGPGITSSRCRYLGGLKKWVPSQWRQNSSGKPAAKLPTGSPLVLELMTVPGLRKVATRSRRFRLISRFSATASIIQSASATHERWSSKFPGVIHEAFSGR